MNQTAVEATSDDLHRAFIGAAIVYVVVNVISGVAADAQLRLIFWLRQHKNQGATEMSQGTTELETITASPAARHVTSLIHPRLRIQVDSAVKAAKRKRMVLKLLFNVVGCLHIGCIAVSCLLGAEGHAVGASGCGALLCITLSILLLMDPSMPRQMRSSFVFLVAGIGNITSCCAGIGAFVALAPLTPGPDGPLKTADHPKLAQFHFMLSLLMSLWTTINFLHALNTQRILFVTKLPLSGTIDDLVKEQKRGLGTTFSCDILSLVRAYYLESARFYAMPIRTACNHAVDAFQIYSLAMGFVTLVFVAIMFVQLQVGVPQTAGPEYLAQLDYLSNGLVLGSLLPMGLIFMVINPLMSSRPIRIWFNRRIAAIGTSSPKSRRDVATNLLMGEEEPDVVIERAKANFCGIPMRELSPAIFSATSTTAELYPKTHSLELGACDAFLSHSWHDDWTLKYKALKEWGADYVPPSGGQDVVVWWDRACIQVEPSQLSQALSCLPIYVSGCRRMVVLAGPTFPERLWCAVELFIFSELGGGLSFIDVWPFQIPSSGGATTIADSFHSFEVAKTQCTSDLDKDYFTSVIEAAFGGEDPFNAIVREILGEALQKGREATGK